MAQASQLSRYRPAIISVIGITAACSIYAFYKFQDDQASTSTSLRRSNAVHRPRRDRQQPSIDWQNSAPEAPLGWITLRKDDLVSTVNFMDHQFPTFEEFRHMFPHATEEGYRKLEDAALDMILSSCFVATLHPVALAGVENLGFGSLLEAMLARDEDQIRQDSHRIRTLLHLDHITDEQLEQAVNRFLVSDKWLGGLDSGSEGDAADPAETEEDVMDDANREPSQRLRGLLYYIAEEDSKRKAYEHRGITCESCNQFPIRGIRWHCLNCPDFDLCSTCEMRTPHPQTHVFAKIKIPLPVLSQPTKEYRLWYPGDPRKVHGSLDANLKKRLCQESGFQEPQMDAFYDQFTCIANIPWTADPAGVKAAIDRKAFIKAMSCEKWPTRFASNAVFDRMFAFYDIGRDGKSDGLIGFEEFISGMAYLRGDKRFVSLQRAIRGFDMDGNGFVSRADFLKLLRAKYAIQKQLVSDMVEGQEIEQTRDALEILRSSQPISSAFSQEDIPPGEFRPMRGKQQDGLGDMRPLEDTRTILEDADSWVRNPSRRNRSKHAHERLRHLSSRFEELLYPAVGQSPQELHGSMDQVDGIATLEDDEEEDTSSHEMRRAELRNADETEVREPHVEDILWNITEDGFRDLLDKLFRSKELEGQEIVDTHAERQLWRQEIDSMLKDRRQLQEQFAAAASVDPLAATALSSLNKVAKPKPSVLDEQDQLPFNGDIVPTDEDSLTKWEEDIASRPLDDLLNASGYSVRGADESSRPRTRPRAAASGSSTIYNGNGPRPATHPLSNMVSLAEITETADPTLPQNRPNTDTNINQSDDEHHEDQVPEASAQDTAMPVRPPPKERLEYLAMIDDAERQLQAQGGPGRLSYDEIESIAVADSTGQLRSLIKSWLEWASF